MAGMKRFVTYIYAYEEEKREAMSDLRELRSGDRMQELRFICAASMRRLRHAECICSSGKRQAGRKQQV